METQLPRIHIVTGKGGVGKTVVAASLAMAWVRSGKRVLLCELHGRDRVADLLGVEPVGYTLRQVFEDFTLVDINPRDAIREYALLTLRFEAVYRAVFENRLIRTFVNLVPSLGELVMLGKIWYHAQETVRERPRFDHIVVDAPATGHAIALLGAPRAVHNTVPAGPMRDNARLLHDMLTDAQQTRLTIVTTPEEMPITEALELGTAARGLGVALGPIIVNQQVAPLPPGALAALQPLAQDPRWAGGLQALERREAKRQRGERDLARLTEGGRVVTLPRLAQDTLDRAAVEALAAHLAPGCREGIF